MAKILPILAVIIAAFGYGSYYVPVKKYDIHDGLVYQWFLCCGILIGALFMAVVRNDWLAQGMSSNAFYAAPESVLSGFIWSIANVLATRSVQYIGIGNYYLWHELTNLGGTFVIGVLGPQLGIPARTPSHVWLAALGFIFVFLGMVPVVFMKSEGGEESCCPHQSQIVEQSGNSRGNLDELFVHREEDTDFSRRGSGCSTPGARTLTLDIPQVSAAHRLHQGLSPSRTDANALTWDGTLGRPDITQLQRLRFPSQPLTFDSLCSSGGLPIVTDSLEMDEDAEQGQILAGAAKSSWLKGLILAMGVGVILSLQYEPMLPWQHRLALQGLKVSGLEYVFGNCLGIFLFSTIYLLVGGGWKRINRQPMQKPVLRPALFAGFVWTMSAYCQLYAMVEIPYAVAYCAVVGGGLAVSLLWGTFRFGEAKTTHNRICLAFSFLGISIGIFLLGLAA